MRQHGQPMTLYCEGPISRNDTLKMERSIKGWSGKKKLELVEKSAHKRGNPVPPTKWLSRKELKFGFPRHSEKY